MFTPSKIEQAQSKRRNSEVSPMKTVFRTRSTMPLAVLTGFLILGSGCKTQPPAEQPPAAAQQTPATPPPARDDQQIGTDIQAKISAESALNGQDIQVAVLNGVATLNGKVDNDASRALAAADSASIDGVKTVVNNLVVAPAKAAKVAPPPPPRPERKRREVAQAMPPPPPPQPQEQVQVVPPPPPPP